MTDQAPRPLPQSTVQVVGAAAHDVVNGLKSSPLILGLFVLNAVGIAAACWFLAALVTSSDRRMEIILKACLPHATGGGP